MSEVKGLRQKIDKLADMMSAFSKDLKDTAGRTEAFEEGFTSSGEDIEKLLKASNRVNQSFFQNTLQDKFDEQSCIIFVFALLLAVGMCYVLYFMLLGLFKKYFVLFSFELGRRNVEKPCLSSDKKCPLNTFTKVRVSPSSERVPEQMPVHRGPFAPDSSAPAPASASVAQVVSEDAL